MIKRLFSNIIVSLVLCCFFLFPTNSLAGQANLAWDPPDISTDVTGYMLHYGTASGTYSQAVDVGNTTSYTVSNLLDGQTYFFAVTAYNAVGYESVYSNEVSILMSPLQYLLMISNPGPGQGIVSGSGISCGDTCLAAYNAGAVVSLSASAAPGSIFDGWSGGGCSGTGLCTVTMNTNMTVTANFKTAPPAPTTVPTTTTTSTTTVMTSSSTTSVSTTSIPPTTLTTSTTTVMTTSSTTSIPPTTRYSITASVNGAGGRISPAGTAYVSVGGSLKFSITPASRYRIASVTVDGKSIRVVNSYTFRNVTANHTITVTFRRRH